jgi:hypothetical protein
MPSHTLTVRSLLRYPSSRKTPKVVCRCTTTNDREPALVMKEEEDMTPPTSPFVPMPPTPVSPTGRADPASIPFGTTSATTPTNLNTAIPFVPYPVHHQRPPRPQDLHRISTSNLARSTGTPTPFSPSPGPSVSPSPNTPLSAQPAPVGLPPAQAEHYHCSPHSSPLPSPTMYSAGHPAPQVAWHSPVQQHPLSQVHSPETAYFPSQPHQSGPPPAGMHLDLAQPQPGSAHPHGHTMGGMGDLAWSTVPQTYQPYSLGQIPATWDWGAMSQLEDTAAPTRVLATAPVVDYPRSPVDSVYSRQSTESSQTHPFPSSHHPSPPSSRSNSAPRTLENGAYLDGTAMTEMMAGRAHAEAAMNTQAHVPQPVASTSMVPALDLNRDESQSWNYAMMSQEEMQQYHAIAAYYQQAPLLGHTTTSNALEARMHIQIKPDPSPPLASRSAPPHFASEMTAPTGPHHSGAAQAYSAQLLAHQAQAMQRAQHEVQTHGGQGYPISPQDYMSMDMPPSNTGSSMGGTFADYQAPDTYTHQYAMPLQPPPHRPPHGPPPAQATASLARPSLPPVVLPRQPARYPPASAGPGPAPQLPFANNVFGQMQHPPAPLSAPADGMGMEGYFEALAQDHHPGAQYHHMHPQGQVYQEFHQPHMAMPPPGSAPPHLTTFGMHPDMHPHMHMHMHTRMRTTPPPHHLLLE